MCLLLPSVTSDCRLPLHGLPRGDRRPGLVHGPQSVQVSGWWGEDPATCPGLTGSPQQQVGVAHRHVTLPQYTHTHLQPSTPLHITQNKSPSPTRAWLTGSYTIRPQAPRQPSLHCFPSLHQSRSGLKSVLHAACGLCTPQPETSAHPLRCPPHGLHVKLRPCLSSSPNSPPPLPSACCISFFALIPP